MLKLHCEIMAGLLQKKILILLMSGIALGLTASPLKQFRVIREAGTAWKQINRDHLKRAIRNLYKSKLISIKENSGGQVTIILTNDGKNTAQTYKLNEINIQKQKSWDRKWRFVLFDIPNKHKKARDTLRFQLKRMNFFEYQKSVFVTPYPCFKEINFLSEFYRVKPFVRYVLATKLDNELHLKHHFKLL